MITLACNEMNFLLWRQLSQINHFEGRCLYMMLSFVLYDDSPVSLVMYVTLSEWLWVYIWYLSLSDDYNYSSLHWSPVLMSSSQVNHQCNYILLYKWSYHSYTAHTFIHNNAFILWTVAALKAAFTYNKKYLTSKLNWNCSFLRQFASE